MSRPDSWMPLYWADFLADTLHLNRAEIGSYMLLIGAYWRRGSALPDDDEFLRNICRCQGQEWARCKGTLASFFSVKDGLWTHKRIEQELKEAKEEYERQMARTKAATEARRRAIEGRNESRDVVGDDGARRDETCDVACTQPQPQPQPQPYSQPQPQPYSQPQSQSPSGRRAPEKKLGAAEMIKVERELLRVNAELKDLGSIGDYAVGSKKRGRIVELTERQAELRQRLGVKA